MSDNHIDKHILSDLVKHNNRLGIKRILKSLSYERAAELPYVYAIIRSRTNSNILRILDVGTGDSVFPSFLLKNENVDITCLDKYDWVAIQDKYAKATVAPDKLDRINIVKLDLFDFEQEALFDVITCISVIEHFPGNKDAEAMKHIASLLKPGGILILTTPVNEGFADEFYKNKAVYGKHEGGGAFYQRHYDLDGIEHRLIGPSGLKESERIYFGEYGYPFGQKFLFPSWKNNPLKVFYKWASPWFAKKYLTYSKSPISNPALSVDTASGVILVLTKLS